MSTTGKRIRDRRIELGMTADDLAARLGKNRATIYRYESDEIENFPVSVIGPLSSVLQVSPAYLMGWEEKKESAPENEGGLDDLDKEIMSFLHDLTLEQKQFLLAQLKTLREQNQ